MKKAFTHILKWLFLILFTVGMIYGFFVARNISHDLQGSDLQKRIIAL